LINQAVDDTTLLPEFDALYLDMNGLIHTATHGNEGVSKKLDEKDLMLTMFASIDFMVKTIKPRKLLYMAIDGCAPRAKMNQQRSRRFRAARDLAEARREAASRGEVHTDEDVFDSNCITPGTEFMEAVSQYMQYFVRKKLREDPLWQRMEVIYSGHDVPGEGEHKIVQYIRAAKLDPAYDPNMRHCMAGLDADLIMLGLATHEPHFSLLREQVDFNSFRSGPFDTKSKVSAGSRDKGASARSNSNPPPPFSLPKRGACISRLFPTPPHTPPPPHPI
jgi:5'-3' exoribonuclease 1